MAYNPSDLLSPPNEDAYDPRHPPQLSEVAVEAFTDVTTPSILGPALSQEPHGLASNFSQSGIVHLGPIDSPASGRSHSLVSSRGRASRNSGSVDAGHRDMEAAQHSLARRGGSVTSGSASESASASGSAAMSGSSKSVGTGTSSEGPRITFRYQDMEDEEGHHLIVGREGKLTRCEDEVWSRRSCISSDHTDVVRSQFAHRALCKDLVSSSP